jgi:dihydroneopterin aldolase
MSEYEPTDTIFLHDLRIETVVGIWDWERKIRQTVSIDLEMGGDIRRAAESDRIEATLNYKAVAKRVQQFVAESSFKLVETLAEKIASLVLNEFEVPWICVRVSKPGAIRGARDVGVSIRRSRPAD